jgi:hypothetical protein
MNVVGASMSSGAFVIQYPCGNYPNGQWALNQRTLSDGKTVYQLENVKS